MAENFEAENKKSPCSNQNEKEILKEQMSNLEEN